MSSPLEIRAQLQGLRIPKEQRPAAGRGPNGRRPRSGLVVLLVVLLAGAGGLYLARNQLRPLADGTAAAAEVRTVRVAARQAGDALPVLTATGKIVSDHKVEVMAKVSGQLVALFFEQGDRVKQGHLLARIEDVNYRARRDEAVARLAKGKATLEFARFNLERIAGLYQKDTAPKVEFLEAQRGVNEAQAQVAMDQAVLDFASKALRDTEVVAPIAGVVLERNVEVGDFVAAEGGRGMVANAQVASIADMTTLRVEVDVSELDIARIKAGMPCTIAPDAYKDRRYHGRVMWIDPGANYSKATVQVKVRIEDPDDYLRVEGSAQVVFQEPPASAPAGGTTSSPATQQAAIWIPSGACLPDASGQRATVFVVADGRVRATTVSIGRRTGGQVEILAGLQDGQAIAADGLEKLADGQRVRS